jgi:hypothetical protein
MQGGYLMCNAYDLAWATAHLYFKDRPHLVSIDDIHFVYPVSLGSLLTFDAYVITLVFVHETLSPPPPPPPWHTDACATKRAH